MNFVQIKHSFMLVGLLLSLTSRASGGASPTPEVIVPGALQAYPTEAQSRDFLARFVAHDAALPITPFQANGANCWMTMGSAPQARPYIEQLRFLMQQSAWGQRLGKAVFSNLFVLLDRGGLKTTDSGGTSLQLVPIALDSDQGLETLADIHHFLDCEGADAANFDGYTKVPLGGTVGKQSDPMVSLFLRAGEIDDLQEVFLTSVHEMHSFVDRKHVMPGWSLSDAYQKGLSGTDFKVQTDADLELVFHTFRAFRLESHIYADLVRAGWFAPRDKWQHFIANMASEPGCRRNARAIGEALYSNPATRAKVTDLIEHTRNCIERAEPDLGASEGSIGTEQDQPKPHIKDW